MEEIWKEIKGFDGRFSISNFWRVRQNKGQYITLQKHVINYEEKILVPITWQSRYLRIDLNLNRKKHMRLNTYIHKLVAEYFIGERPEGYDIDHIDGNYLNNRADNLRYVTSIENKHNPNTINKRTYKKFTDEERLQLSIRMKEVMNRPEVKEKLRKKHNMSKEGSEKLRQLAIERNIRSRLLSRTSGMTLI